MLVDEVGAYITAQALVPVGFTLRLGASTDTPDNLIVVREYMGAMPHYNHSLTGIGYENPRLQIECRSKNYLQARTTAEAIYRKLATVSEQVLSGCRYLRITPLQSPFLMGRDANGRERIIFNSEVNKEVSP